MATAMRASIPAIILLVIAQRYIAAGATGGAVRGNALSVRPSDMVRVLVWGENRHEQTEPHVAAIYPEGMHTTIAAGIAENLGDGARVQTTTLDAPEHGLTEEVLEDLDVLVWWGTCRAR